MDDRQTKDDRMLWPLTYKETILGLVGLMLVIGLATQVSQLCAYGFGTLLGWIAKEFDD